MDELTAQKLDRLAWLYLSKGSVSAESTGLSDEEIAEHLVIVDGNVTFRGPEGAAVQRAKAHIKREAFEGQPANVAAVFEKLEEFWLHGENARAQSLHAEVLADHHNAGHADALVMAIEALEQGADVFTVARVMSDVLPKLEKVDPALLVDFVDKSRSRMGQDLMSGLPLNATNEWLRRHPEQIEPVVAFCMDSATSSAGAVLRIALAQAVALDKSVWFPRWEALLKDENSTLRKSALEAVGLIDWTGADPSFVEEALTAIRGGMAAGEDDAVVTSGLALLGMVGTYPKAHTLLDDLIALNKPYVVRLVGDHVAYRTNFLELPWLWEKLSLLAAKVKQHPGSYSGVDHVLTGLYAQSPDKVMAWLHTWAEAQADDLPDDPRSASLPKVFHELFSKMRRDDTNALLGLLATWLMHDHLAVQRMARQAFDELALGSQNALAIPKDLLDRLSQAELLMLARRVLANVFRADQQISLLWSFVEAEDAEQRTFPILRGAFREIVSRDYPSAVEEQLCAIRDADATSVKSALAGQIIERQEAQFQQLEELKTTTELRVTEEEWLRFKNVKRRSMALAMEEASKESIFHQIVTRLPLKAGRSSFSMRQGRPGEKIQLSSVSHSMLLPRSELIDPVGSAMRRFGFQVTKAGDE